MERTFRNCQSCGMPLKRDEQGGARNADGSKSAMYCSHCYDHGRLTLPDITVEQMQSRVREKIMGFGFPRFAANFFTRGISKLARWQQQ